MPKISMFDELPDGAFVRQTELVQRPQSPTVSALLPFSASTLWRKVAAGTFPRPYRLSSRITAWKVAEVRAWIASQPQS